MSVADRLNKLSTDITNAYTSINNKGGTIPANKNTDNLHTAIDSIEVIEQATAEGESLSLTNTKAMPYSDYVVKGKSEQDGEPSPSNPSEIHSVIHSVADDVNLFDIENTTARYGNVSKEINDNHLILTATGTEGAQVVQNIISDVDSSKKYTLSFKAKKTVKGTDGEPVIEIIVYGSNDDTNYTLLERLRQDPVEGQEYSFNKTVTGYNYYRFYIYNNASTPVTVGEKTEYWDIKFQEGTVATPYSPYNQGTVTIKQRGKNLFDASKFASATSNGITLSFNSDGNIVLNQTATAQANFNSSHIDMDGSINTGDMVTLSGGSENVTVAIQTFTSDDTYIGASRDSGSTVKYTIPNNASKYAFNIRIPSGTVLSDYVLKPQLEKGSTATDYEPYQANDYTIQTSPLRSLPNGVKDTIELQDMQNHTRIGRQTGTLTETTTITLSDAKTNGAYMCNIKPSGTLTGKTKELEAGDYEIIYELEEEIIEPLTQQQATTMLDITHTGSYEGTTNIYTDEDVKPTIKVDYYKKK